MNYVLFEIVFGAKCEYGCLFDWLFSNEDLFWGETDMPKTKKYITNYFYENVYQVF